MKTYTGNIVFKARGVYWVEDLDHPAQGYWHPDRRLAKRYPTEKRWDILTERRRREGTPGDREIWLLATTVFMIKGVDPHLW